MHCLDIPSVAEEWRERVTLKSDSLYLQCQPYYTAEGRGWNGEACPSWLLMARDLSLNFPKTQNLKIISKLACSFKGDENKRQAGLPIS